MKNKHVNGPKNYCQFSSCQRILLTEMSCYVNSVLLMSILWYYDMQYESNMYLYVAWLNRHCGLGLSLICFGLGLTENFWLRPHTFWPRPWPHPSLASLTSLVFDILGRLSLLESRANRRVQKKQTNKQMHYSELQISQHSFTSDICSSIVLEIHKQLNWM